MTRPAGVLFLLMLLLSLSVPVRALSQQMAVGSNLLYWLATTPNVRGEWMLGGRYTLSSTLGMSHWNYRPRVKGRETIIYDWLIYPELKCWTDDPFRADYFGIHAFFGQYDVSDLRWPRFLYGKRYNGYGMGFGISYGYLWSLGRHWALEASLGIGFVYTRYRRYELADGDGEREKRSCYGVMPTKVGLSFVYILE